MQTKTQQVIDYLKQANIKEALNISKTFKIGFTKEEQTIITRAYEMMWNSKFYEQLGFDKRVELKKATNILLKKYEKELSIMFKNGNRVKVIKDIGYLGETPDNMFVGCEGEIVEYNIYDEVYRVKLDNTKDIYDFKPEELQLIKE